MKWVRRVIAILLILILVPTLIFTLVMMRVDETVSKPGFYNGQMDKANMYNFLYDQALPSALAQVEDDNPSDMPVRLTEVKAETVSAARQILPPDWLRTQFESSTRTLVPYFLGDADRFSNTYVLKDRVQAAAQVMRDDFLVGGTFRSLYNDAAGFLAEKATENLDRLPYDAHLTKAGIEQAMRKSIPSDWLVLQVPSAINAATPYFTGEKNRFTITIKVADRVDPTAAAMLDLFNNQATYDYLMDELIVPEVERNLSQIVTLPYGVSLTRAEVTSAVRQVLPPEWIELRLEEVIYGIASYVKGEKSIFAVTVDLGERKPAALNVLTQLADQKLAASFDRLPICSLDEFSRLIRNLPPGTLPTCRPTSLSYEQIKSMLGINLADSVKRYVGDPLPNQWTYSEADLRRSLGSENADFLDKTRQWVWTGWTFTEADLKDKLSAEQNKKLEDVRGWIASGYMLDQTKLRGWISDNPSDLKSFDDARNAIHSARQWRWVVGLLPFILLIAIGFLCGRDWKGRVYWAFISLLIISLVVCIGVTVAYSSAVKPAIRDAFDLSGSGHTAFEQVMLEKGQQVALNAAESLISGVRNKALTMAIMSGVVLVGTFFWSRRSSHRKGTGDL